MNSYSIKQLLSNTTEIIQKKIIVNGWVRFFRSNKFIILNDGSSLKNLQIIINNNLFNKEFLKQITIGSAIKVEGVIINSLGSKQLIELQAEKIKIYNTIASDKLQKTILQPKHHSLTKLREQAHLRFKTNIFSAVMRIRHHLAFAIHKYFYKRDFFYINTPIITSFDSEGLGETFQVTTLNSYETQISNQDFFGRRTYLTVSGQLEAEIAAMGLKKVYSFGPVFRAEKSNTSRHLAEFWMVEPEIAFFNLNDNINLAEHFLKFLITYILNHCKDDLVFLNNYNYQYNDSKNNLLELLSSILSNPFIRISYSEAIKILKFSQNHKKSNFIHPVYWGMNLQSEHEKFIVEKHFNFPTILYDYPQSVKAFYMRVNNDGKTVAAMDVLFPKIGEIIGGSEREERYDYLLQQMQLFNIKYEDFWWYLDIRLFGSSPHSGFGLGFDRLVQFITGMNNIRDVIAFPRTHKYVEF